MGGGGSAPSNTTQTTKPFPAQERALTQLFGLAENQFGQGPQGFFPGDTVGAQSQNTVAAQQLALDAVNPQAQLGMAGFQSAMAGLDPNSAQSQAIINPMIANLQSQILPSIGSNAIQQGAFGGDRQRIQEQQAAEATTASAMQALMANQQQAIGSMGMVNQGLLQPAQTASSVGAQQEARNQAIINAERQRFMFGQESPETALDRLGSRVSGVNLGQITNSSSGGSGSSSGRNLGTAVGAGLTAYGLAK